MSLSYPQHRSNGNIIDLCKFIMAILVVAIHTEPLATCSNHNLTILFKLITSMAVPFFFLATGYLLGSKINVLQDPRKKTALLSRYLCKIAKLYLLWTIIYFPLALYDCIHNGKPLDLNILFYIRGFLFVGEQYNSWHLWYLLSTIYALILIIAMIRFNFNPVKQISVICTALILSIVLDAFSGYSGPLPTFLQFGRKVIQSTVINGRILRGLFYIPAGILLASKKLPVKICLPLFFISFAANYVVSNSSISNVLVFLSSIAFFGTIIHIRLRDHVIYPFMRKISTVTYLIHMYIWTFYYILVYKEKTFGWDSFVVTAIICIAVGAVYNIIQRKTSITRKAEV